MSDLSPEQAFMVAVLVNQGYRPRRALRIVRSERVLAYGLGAHLLPVAQDLAQRWSAVAERARSLGLTDLT